MLKPAANSHFQENDDADFSWVIDAYGQLHVITEDDEQEHPEHDRDSEDGR